MKETVESVFIVDDDEAVLDSLRVFLEASGFAVKTYASPESFLDDYHVELRGCVLLDIQMPTMSGLGLQEDLVAIGSVLPIIFMTGHADVPTAVQALKAGAFDFIQKPFDNGRLLELVARAFEVNRQDRQVLEQQQRIKARLQTLTPRETEVLDYIINGKASKVIASELNLSQRTVEIYRANVMQKMQARSVAQLVRSISEFSIDPDVA
ncbi:MAG: response regulator [Pseudomonadales bacterium]|nr:response regulator [Pseudomonadales bacterium]